MASTSSYHNLSTEDWIADVTEEARRLHPTLSESLCGTLELMLREQLSEKKQRTANLNVLATKLLAAIPLPKD